MARLPDLLVEEGYPLAKVTTMRIGGPAQYFCTAGSIAGIQAALTFAREKGLSVVPIGGGSNLLVSDTGVDGLVIRVNQTQMNPKRDGGNVTVFAGVSLIAFAYWTVRQGLSGLEWAAGVPGTVGGSAVMNAGAHGKCMADNVSRITVVMPDGSLETIDAPDIRYAYRHSELPPDSIVAEVTFGLEEGDTKASLAQMAEYKEYRRLTQPWTARTAGCFWRNPAPAEQLQTAGKHSSAGKLIDDAGLKGTTSGSVEVSPIHANFLVNIGESSAADVVSLLDHIHATVQERSGVCLSMEVRTLGFDDGDDPARRYPPPEEKTNEGASS